MDRGDALRQELYERIKSDNEIFDFIQKGSLDGLWYWDLENPEHEWMSPEFWQLFGIDPTTKQHLASEWQDIIHPEDLKKALQNFNAHAEDANHPYNQVVRYRHSDGSTVWVRCRGLILRDHDGKPLRMIGAHTDLTEERKLEQQLMQRLERREHRYETLLKSLKNLVWVTDIHGNMIENSEPWCAFTLQNTDQTGGLGWLEPFHQDDKQTLIDLIKSLADKPLAARANARLFDGIRQTFVSVEIDIAPLLINDEVVEVIWCLEPSSANLDISNQLAETNQKLEQSNIALEQFAYSASHDMKEPLRKITTFGKLLCDQLQERHPASVKDENVALYLEKITKSAERMKGMIDDLLEFARVGTQAAPSVIDLNQVVKNVIEDDEALISEKGAKLNIDTLPQLLGNYHELYQLFANLIGNALKYQPVGQTPEVWVFHQGQNIVVADNGIGISNENRQRIFNMFERLHGKAQYEGSGIGLSIAQKIVQSLEGKINVESRDKGGSRFVISLPKYRFIEN